MGQFHKILNLDKREFLHPHCFNDGLKLLEFGASGDGTMLALAVLLANSRNRGGGDLRSDDETLYGRWAGDRIVIAGDYAEPGDVAEPLEGPNLYDLCYDEATFKDISLDVIKVIRDAGKTIRRED
jgi:hypothetical protein